MRSRYAAGAAYLDRIRKSSRRYAEFGIDGLQSLSRRPHHSPITKITDGIELVILSLRSNRNLFVRPAY